MTEYALVPLLHPAERQMPSLRRLGLRGSDPIALNSPNIGTNGERDTVERVTSTTVKEQRTRWMKIIMLGRQKYVEVIWE